MHLFDKAVPIISLCQMHANLNQVAKLKSVAHHIADQKQRS